jgi:hypothetical protein
MGMGSGIRKKPNPDPGVKNALDPGSGSATLDQAEDLFSLFLFYWRVLTLLVRTLAQCIPPLFAHCNFAAAQAFYNLIPI